MNKANFVKNLHLIISVIIVIPAACIYGLFPSKTLPILFDFQINTIDLKSVFRAIMGLYLGVSIIWILGIFKALFWNSATILNIVFMGGLGLGRLYGLLIDGVPSPTFTYGILGELLLAVFAFYQLKKNSP